MLQANNSQKAVLVVVAVFAIAILFNSSGSGITGYAGWQGWTGCSSGNQCDVGEGDCDNDAECLPGLKCESNVGSDYGFGSTADVCEGVVVAEKVSGAANTGTSLTGLGDWYGISVPDPDGTGQLIVSGLSNQGHGPNYLTVETSLTSEDDDYQSEVVLEVDRGAIKYHLDNSKLLSEILNLNILGHSLKLTNVISDIEMIVNVDGRDMIVKDGEAFIGEDPNRPDWVWDLDNLQGFDYILGVENNFVIHDDKQNPPKIGECITLPNNRANICLEGLSVADNNYYDLVIEYEDSADLSDADATLTNAKAIAIRTSKPNAISLVPNVIGQAVKTDNVWILGNGVVMYRDPGDDKVKFLKQITSRDNEIGTLNNRELGLDVAPIGSTHFAVFIDSETSSGTLAGIFGVKNGQINSLGDKAATEEAKELSWVWTTGQRDIGTKDEDHRSAYGIIVRDSKIHGKSDEIILTIPNRKVNARISFTTGTSVPDSGDEIFLLVGESITFKGNIITLEEVMESRDIVVSITNIIRSKSETDVNIKKIINKETNYDPNNPDVSSATIIIES